MAERCSQCGNQTVMNGRCLNCGHTAGAPAPPATPAPPAQPNPPHSLIPAPPSSPSPPVPIQPNWPTTPTTPQTPQLSAHSLPPPTVNVPSRRAIQLADWMALGQSPPLCEGRVDSITGPQQHQIQPSLLRTLLTGRLLGPSLGPLMALRMQKDYFMWDCRVVDAAGEQYQVIVHSREPTIGFARGDTIAVWGSLERARRATTGRIHLARSYTYDTKTWYQIKP